MRFAPSHGPSDDLRDQLADWVGLTRRRVYPEGTGRGSRDLLHCLVQLEGVERCAVLNMPAIRHQPLHQRAFLHRKSNLRNSDFHTHTCRPRALSVSRMPDSIAAGLYRYSCSNTFAKGTGTSREATRKTGAARSLYKCSWIRAVTSAPTPKLRGASCTTTARRVFATDFRMQSVSNGETVRRSTTSTEMPSPASRSAIASESRIGRP